MRAVDPPKLGSPRGYSPRSRREPSSENPLHGGSAPQGCVESVPIVQAKVLQDLRGIWRRRNSRPLEGPRPAQEPKDSLSEGKQHPIASPAALTPIRQKDQITCDARLHAAPVARMLELPLSPHCLSRAVRLSSGRSLQVEREVSF